MEQQALRRILIKVINIEPNLTVFGLGVYEERKLSKSEREKKFRKDREHLFESTDAFQLACMWLSFQERTKNINRLAASSYGLKHEAERWARNTFPLRDCYISNGSLIAAAIHLGFKYEPTDLGSPNVYLNISKRRTK